jgi:hypothetical protein
MTAEVGSAPRLKGDLQLLASEEVLEEEFASAAERAPTGQRSSRRSSIILPRSLIQNSSAEADQLCPPTTSA